VRWSLVGRSGAAAAPDAVGASRRGVSGSAQVVSRLGARRAGPNWL